MLSEVEINEFITQETRVLIEISRSDYDSMRAFCLNGTTPHTIRANLENKLSQLLDSEKRRISHQLIEITTQPQLEREQELRTYLLAPLEHTVLDVTVLEQDQQLQAKKTELMKRVEQTGYKIYLEQLEQFLRAKSNFNPQETNALRHIIRAMKKHLEIKSEEEHEGGKLTIIQQDYDLLHSKLALVSTLSAQNRTLNQATHQLSFRVKSYKSVAPVLAFMFLLFSSLSVFFAMMPRIAESKIPTLPPTSTLTPTPTIATNLPVVSYSLAGFTGILALGAVAYILGNYRIMMKITSELKADNELIKANNTILRHDDVSALRSTLTTQEGRIAAIKSKINALKLQAEQISVKAATITPENSYISVASTGGLFTPPQDYKNEPEVAVLTESNTNLFLLVN